MFSGKREIFLKIAKKTKWKVAIRRDVFCCLTYVIDF